MSSLRLFLLVLGSLSSNEDDARRFSVAVDEDELPLTPRGGRSGDSCWRSMATSILCVAATVVVTSYAVMDI